MDEFPSLLALRPPSRHEGILFTVYRQSGNVERQEEFFTEVDAIRAAQKLFRRMKQPEARIWQNTENSVDVRRPYYNARGRSEGKVISGVLIQIVSASGP